MRQMRDSDSNAMIIIGGTPNLLLQRKERSGGAKRFSYLSSLLPVLPRFHTEDSGEQIRSIEEEFAWYLDRVDRWSWWIDVNDHIRKKDLVAQYLKEAGTAAQALYPNVAPLAKTRFGRPIAFMLSYVVTSAGSAAFVEGHYKANDIVATFGPLVWLPPMTEAPIEAVDLILAHLLNIGSVEQAPEWSERYQLPEEEAALSHLKSLEAEKREIEERIRLGEERLRDEQRFKRLLYEQHAELETTVWEALEELGATVHRPSTKNEEDGRLEDPRGRPAMLEIKGRRGSLKLQEVRQLHDWMENAYHNEGWEGKGIVVGNAHLLEDPEARAEPFPDNCIQAAKRYEQCLINSKQLFDMIGASQGSQWDQLRFWDSVFETNGVWRP